MKNNLEKEEPEGPKILLWPYSVVHKYFVELCKYFDLVFYFQAMFSSQGRSAILSRCYKK